MTSGLSSDGVSGGRSYLGRQLITPTSELLMDKETESNLRPLGVAQGCMCCRRS